MNDPSPRALPDGVERPEPHPDSPPPGTDLGAHYAGCFACGAADGGLRMRFVAGQDMTVRATYTVVEAHQGAPSLAHGGVLSAAIDEALGSLAVYVGQPTVTGRLSLEYRRPVPVGTVVHIVARLDGRAGRKLYYSADARLDAPDGPVAVRAEAVFVAVGIEHFERYAGEGVRGMRADRAQRWLAVNP